MTSTSPWCTTPASPSMNMTGNTLQRNYVQGARRQPSDRPWSRDLPIRCGVSTTRSPTTFDNNGHSRQCRSGGTAPGRSHPRQQGERHRDLQRASSTNNRIGDPAVIGSGSRRRSASWSAQGGRPRAHTTLINNNQVQAVLRSRHCAGSGRGQRRAERDTLRTTRCRTLPTRSTRCTASIQTTGFLRATPTPSA